MLNTSHPDYKKYREEFENLKEELDKRLDSLEKSESHGKDGSSSIIYKDFALNFEALKKKYYYLF